MYFKKIKGGVGVERWLRSGEIEQEDLHEDEESSPESEADGEPDEGEEMDKDRAISVHRYLVTGLVSVNRCL